MFQDPLANPTGGIAVGSPLLEAIFFPFIEEICLGTAQVDDLWATISIFFLDGALLAVVGIRHSWSSADHTAPLVRAIVTLVTYAHQGAGPHVGVTDHTLAITFFTESSNCDAGLLAAEDWYASYKNGYKKRPWINLSKQTWNSCALPRKAPATSRFLTKQGSMEIYWRRGSRHMGWMLCCLELMHGVISNN